MNISYSVLIIGCAKHEIIAKKYFELAKMFWGDSLNKTIFCTDKITDYQSRFPCEIVEETSENFAKRILSGIEKTNSKYIVLMLDDYYLTDHINSGDIQNLMIYLDKSRFKYCKLIGLPKCFSRNKEFKGTYHIKKQTHYGISLQPSIWEKEALIEALGNCKGNSAWEVEAAFSKYQDDNYQKCLTFNRNYLKFRNGVLRGKLFPYTNKLLEKNNIEPLKIERISLIKYFSFIVKQRLSAHLPSWLRKIGKKIGRKTGKKYYSSN